MIVTGATSADRAAVVALFTDRQADPNGHVCYLSCESDAIAAELAGLEPDGWCGVLVARSGGEVVGALALEHDLDPPRVWWHGPSVARHVAFAEVGDALLRAGRARLPRYVVEEELGPDERNTDLADLARRHGFRADPASAVLSRRVEPVTITTREAAASPAVRPFTEVDRPAVAALFDAAFPASHVPGARVDEGTDRTVLVAHLGDEVTGAVAAERQEDGAGYLDLLAVDPTARRAGVGAALVEAAVADLADRFGCTAVHLTVREDNDAARRLYARLGFAEERLIRPWRRGFHVT